MPALQIKDVDQKTMVLLGRWAAEHGRTLEEEVRGILQRVAARIEVASAEPGQSRGALSLEPMALSAEDAALLDEAWRGGLARPKIAIAPLPRYEG
jgi:plasmid stability protein